MLVYWILCFALSLSTLGIRRPGDSETVHRSRRFKISSEACEESSLRSSREAGIGSDNGDERSSYILAGDSLRTFSFSSPPNVSESKDAIPGLLTVSFTGTRSLPLCSGEGNVAQPFLVSRSLAASFLNPFGFNNPSPYSCSSSWRILVVSLPQPAEASAIGVDLDEVESRGDTSCVRRLLKYPFMAEFSLAHPLLRSPLCADPFGSSYTPFERGRRCRTPAMNQFRNHLPWREVFTRASFDGFSWEGWID